MMTSKSALLLATASAIALASFDLRPAVAAPEGGLAIAQQNTSDEFSSQRRRRARGVNPALPLAAFGAIVGTIGAVAAANSRRDYYPGQYYAAPQYDEEPAYGYYSPPVAQYYERPVYQQQRPVYQQRPARQQRDYYNRYGGSGGQPGYRGPNRNVPGPTNYGNAAGQNGQAPPLVSNPAPP